MEQIICFVTIVKLTFFPPEFEYLILEEKAAVVRTRRIQGILNGKHRMHISTVIRFIVSLHDIT